MQAWTAGLQATAGPRSSFVFVMPGERLQATHCPGQRDTNCNYQLGLMLHHGTTPWKSLSRHIFKPFLLHHQTQLRSPLSPRYQKEFIRGSGLTADT